MLTKIYDIEYSSTDEIVITLPPPLFINVTNTNQLIVNTTDFCNSIVETYMPNEQDDNVKQAFAKELKQYYLGSYLNLDVIRKLESKARQSVTKAIVSNPESIQQ